jgi:hypothetical protein
MNRKTQSIIGLSFFLLILPIFTFIVLRSGFEYRRTSLSLLDNLSELDSSAIANSLGGEVPLSSSIFVWTALHRDNIAQVNKIYHQFKNRVEIYFLLDTAILSSTTKDTFSILKIESSQLVLGDFPPNRWIVDSLNRNVYPTQFIFFGDYTGYLRNAYDPTNDSEMGKLIEHIAMRLKAPERKRIIFQRENEK